MTNTVYVVNAATYTIEVTGSFAKAIAVVADHFETTFEDWRIQAFRREIKRIGYVDISHGEPEFNGVPTVNIERKRVL